MNIGDRLRVLRGAASQAAFGETIGVAQTTIRNYENGNRFPDSEFIKAVCDKYDVSADWLLFGDKTRKIYNVGNDTLQHIENIGPESEIFPTVRKTTPASHPTPGIRFIGPDGQVLMDTSTLGARLRFVRGSMTKAEFANFLGMNIHTYIAYEGNKRVPNSDTIEDMAKKLTTPLEWLERGEGSPYPPREPDLDNQFQLAEPQTKYGGLPQKLSPEEPTTSIVHTKNMSGDESDCALGLVPMVEARLSAGHGGLETSDKIVSWFAFQLEFLRRRGQPSQMVLMKVAGNSMAPNIRNNDIVLIDQSQKDVQAGQIYAVGVEDLIYLKLIDTKPGTIVLSSINPKYPPIEVPVTDSSARQVPILGRCIWSCHEW